jgi:hypothetical protein
MKIKKLLLLGAVAAIAGAVAVPASASASVWKEGGTNLSKEISLGLSGGELAEAGSKIMSCEIHATMTTSGGSTGSITAWETKSCGLFGELEKCTMTSSEAVGLPWAVTVNTSNLTISNWHIKRTFKAGCATSEINKTVASVPVTLLSTTAITEMEFLGQITGFKTGGSFKVDSPNSGKYGIG